jgi:hypothetical protein
VSSTAYEELVKSLYDVAGPTFVDPQCETAENRAKEVEKLKRQLINALSKLSRLNLAASTITTCIDEYVYCECTNGVCQFKGKLIIPMQDLFADDPTQLVTIKDELKRYEEFYGLEKEEYQKVKDWINSLSSIQLDILGLSSCWSENNLALCIAGILSTPAIPDDIKSLWKKIGNAWFENKKNKQN